MGSDETEIHFWQQLEATSKRIRRLLVLHPDVETRAALDRANTAITDAITCTQSYESESVTAMCLLPAIDELVSCFEAAHGVDVGADN